MTSCNHLAKRWFRTTTLKATYQALIYPLGEYDSWELPTNLQVVKPPSMVKPQPGRPKNKDRIRSQGEEPRENSCQRCGSGAHTRGECSAPLPKNKKAKKRQMRATIDLQRLPQYPGGSSQGSQPSMSQSYHLDNMADPNTIFPKTTIFPKAINAKSVYHRFKYNLSCSRNRNGSSPLDMQVLPRLDHRHENEFHEPT
ncbi:hypothetical protein CTI12_AA334590 [Artemisia annua]|uniref:Uncharacterized protein n=1 Tax=Artemisia annua TaxID=35608 RepID=A0A2U1MUW8_ARTAN|nr:hypothetical protein CTI12_AA334590 [Artemisia annua]